MVQEPENELWKKEHLFVEEVCASHLDHSEEESGDLEIDGHLLHEFLEELSQPCDSLMLRSVMKHDKSYTELPSCQQKIQHT